MTTFLHGVETTSLREGANSVTEVKSAIMAIIGTAPIHHAASPAAVNVAKLVRSDRDTAQFGQDLAGYTLHRAIKAAQDQGAGVIFAINVFDPTKTEHRTTVASASRNITDGKVQLPHGDLISATVLTSADGPCVEGEDYTIDRVTGLITVLEAGDLDGDATCKVGYVRGNPAGVLSADIVGTVTDGVRSGMQAFLDCASRFGYGPKILLAPGYSGTASVRAAMGVLAQKTKLRAIALADAPAGTTLEEALEGRGPEGEVDLQSADERVILCFPHVKSFRTVTNQEELEGLSGRVAGVIAATDRDVGYHRSPSNREILGITGTEIPLTAVINDATCDVNTLNGAGYLTVFQAYGQPARTWGNRSTAFPGTNGISTFIACRRTMDIIEESIELATMRHLDGPIGSVLIEAVLADVNEFLRILIGRGATMPGSNAFFSAEDNPTSQLQDGQVVFSYRYCPAPPAEHITFKAIVDTRLLAAIAA